MASSILALAYSTFSLGSSSQALSSFLVYSSGCFTICGSCRDKRALWYRVNRTCMVIISSLCPVHKISISGHTGQIDAAVLIERSVLSWQWSHVAHQDKELFDWVSFWAIWTFWAGWYKPISRKMTVLFLGPITFAVIGWAHIRMVSNVLRLWAGANSGRDPILATGSVPWRFNNQLYGLLYL